VLNFILILFYILLGYGIRNLTLIPANLAHYLNKFVIYISLPAMILLQIPKLEFGLGVYIPIAVAWIVMALSAVIIFFASKVFGFTKEVTGALMLVAVLTNSSFIGIPVITAYFGDVTLPYIIIYDQLGTFLALSTYGTVVAAFYSAKSEVSVKIIASKILLFPPFLTMVIAFLIQSITFYSVVTETLEVLAATIIPFALVAVGLQMQFKLPKEEQGPFGVALVVKLLIAPLIAFILCSIFAWEGLIAQVSIMEAGMPPMITAAAMASYIGLAPRLSNAIVGYGILFSFVTTFILYQVIV
jgi:predicted permease